MSQIEFKPESLKQTGWSEYLVRFLFGGIVTVLVGLVARRYGPVIGGLFLAFPSIFPASVTLVAKHAREDGEDGNVAAGQESAGTAIGSLGLLAFGAVVWKSLGGASPVLVIAGATIAWLAVATGAWWLGTRKRRAASAIPAAKPNRI